MNTPSLSKKQKKKAPKANPEQQFNDALERHQRFAALNEKFEQEMLSLIDRVSPQIEPAEVNKYQQLYRLTQKLIPFFSKKSLPEYLREALYEWIDENLTHLSNNPYSHQFDLEALIAELSQHCEQHLDNRQEKKLKQLANHGVPEEEIEVLRDIGSRARKAKSPEEFAELLKEVLQDDSDDAAEEDLFESLFETDPNSTFANFEHEYDDDTERSFYDDIDDALNNKQSSSLDRHFKASNINKLFRKIARTLHPDLEQNEALKAEKHQQMCRLIDARDNKDIAYILQAYKTTFGKLPDTFPDEDYIQLTKIIKQMTERLSENKWEILSEIPFGHIYYEVFYHKKPQKEVSAIREHIKMQEDTAREYQALRAEIKNIPTLKAFLQTKMYYEDMQLITPDDDFPF